MFNKVERGPCHDTKCQSQLKLDLPSTKIRSLPGSTVIRKHSFSFSPSIFDVTTTVMGDLDVVSPDFLPSSFPPSTHLPIHLATPPSHSWTGTAGRMKMTLLLTYLQESRSHSLKPDLLGTSPVYFSLILPWILQSKPNFVLAFLWHF